MLSEDFHKDYPFSIKFPGLKIAYSACLIIPLIPAELTYIQNE
jgi:hypothetical protein